MVAPSSTAAPQFYREAVVEGLLGLAIAAAAVTMAVSEPPPWLHRDAYFVAVAGAFLAGVAMVAASFWATDARSAPELHQQQKPAFEGMNGGLLGLAMASSAITLVVSEPLPWLHDHRDAYFVAVAGALASSQEWPWCLPPSGRPMPARRQSFSRSSSRRPCRE